MDTLDLKDVTLVVHDWGGPIGFLAAVQQPTRFCRFVTFNTGISVLPLPGVLTILRFRTIGSLMIRGLNVMLRAGLYASVVNREEFSRDVRAGYLYPYDSWSNRIAILRFVQEIPLRESHPNQKLLKILDEQLVQFRDHPHLIIWGLRDPIFNRKYLSAWRKSFPAAEVTEIEDASHWVVDEAPVFIAERVRNFLS